MQAQKTLSITAVREAYKRWAPVYDSTFGIIANRGRRKAVELINQRRGGRLSVIMDVIESSKIATTSRQVY